MTTRTIRPRSPEASPRSVAEPFPGAAATRGIITVTGGIIAACAFTFSFGNIWHLAQAWGLPDAIAPLVAPMLDISVIGLLIAIRYLSVTGVPGRKLLSARLLMLACAVTTWGLNIAQAVLDQRWGAVVMDSVAPALLLGWAEVAPALLRLTTGTTVRPMTSSTTERPTAAKGRAQPSGPPSLGPPPGVPRLQLPADRVDEADESGGEAGGLADAA